MKLPNCPGCNERKWKIEEWETEELDFKPELNRIVVKGILHAKLVCAKCNHTLTLQNQEYEK